LLLFVLGSSRVIAEESASSLATKLQAQLLASSEVVMAFTSPTEGKVTVKADLKGKHIRLESPHMLIISDGKTIWNINKKTGNATIDAVSAQSAFRDPAALFKFSENYLPQLVSHSGSTYVLDLIPSNGVSDLFKQAGNDQRLRVTLKASRKSLRIASAKAVSSNGESSTGPVKITQLKTTKMSDFVFERTPKMRVIDLRE
jgi:outer membrane lipoprotein-sorting protein